MEDHSYFRFEEKSVSPSTVNRQKRSRRNRDRRRQKTRINIGESFTRWRALLQHKGFQSDAEVAWFLLDSYDRNQTSVPEPAMRMPLVFSICEESLSSSCSSELEMHSDDSMDVVKRHDPPCDQEIKDVPPAAIELHLSTTNMASSEDGCNEITFDVSEINFAADEDSSTNQDEEQEEEEEEEEEDEDEEETDVSDLEWSKELSDSDQQDKTDSDYQIELNSDSKVHRKVRELCPECGVRFTVGRTHTCEYKIKKFLCNICGKRCTDLGSLKAHSNIHRDNYEHPCKFCLVPFKTKLDKLAHERAHKPSSRPYICPDCTMKFAKLPERNLHLKGHRGPKIISCPHCSLEFTSRHYLNRHIVVHTGMKEFVCEFCSRSFNQAGHLKTHMRVHTGEKPYQCPHCVVSFNHKVSLKSHVMRYHDAASDHGPRGHTRVKMKSTKAGIEKVSTGDTEDMGDVVVINKDPELEEEAKQFRKKYYRSMGRPKGRPKRNAGTTGTDSIPAGEEETREPIAAVVIGSITADASEQASEQASKNIERDWSDRDPTSELTEEDEVEETKGVRKRKHKASQRPKTFHIADEFFDSDSDCDSDLAEEEPKEGLSEVKQRRTTEVINE